MNTYALYFSPRGSLASWPLASDTLFGAVCWGVRVLGLMGDEELTHWLDSLQHEPPFAFSHAFPAYLKDNSPLRLYPRPLNFQLGFAAFDTLAQEWQRQKRGSLKAAKVEVARCSKWFKKINYVSEGILAQIAAGKLTSQAILSSLLFETGAYHERAGVLCSGTEQASLPERLYAVEAVQHNQVDRMAGATVEGALYYREETFFAPGSGLWALLRVKNDRDFDQYLHPALRYLADTGFGADRTAGKGQFEIKVQPAPALPKPAAPTAILALSHYLPEAGELDLQGEPLAYLLKTLRPKREQKYARPLSSGQKSAPVYKQAVRVFEPGSVFPLKQQKDIYGRLARLTPGDQEPVYQSGAALMVYLAGKDG